MKKVKTILLASFFGGSIIMGFIGCKKSATAPSVSTNAISSITQLTATCGGIVTGDGGATVAFRGVCWSTSQNPTIADSKTVDGAGLGGFTSAISGLTGHTVYYVRAYATNSVGTAYGLPMSFTTEETAVTTTAIGNITSNSASSGGTIVSDGGSDITAKGVCWSTSSTPTIANSLTVDGTGTGSYSSTITGLKYNTTYYVCAYITNSYGTTYGSISSFTTLANPPLTDYDGNVYQTVTIGTQTWMSQNLQTTTYNDGTPIQNVTDASTWASLSSDAQCTYNNIANTDSIALYGRIYNGYAVATGKLCPTGWHIPTDAEWTTLENYLIANRYNYDGTTTGNKVANSLASTKGWDVSTTVGTVGYNQTTNNLSGFSGFPAGYRSNGTGSFLGMRTVAYWFSTSEHWYLVINSLPLGTGNGGNETSGYGVRCLKN